MLHNFIFVFPLTFFVLRSSVDPYGLIGQWLGDALNCSVYTYEVAPVFTIMEEYVLAEVRHLIGFDEGDGIFCPGGSIANGYAVNCARYNMFPLVKVPKSKSYFLIFVIRRNLRRIVLAYNYID